MSVFGLVIDVLVIVLLGVTIFYAVQLSRHLDRFRAGRSDMERVLRELGAQTIKAQEAIGILEKAAHEASDELRRNVNKAQALSDELQIITEAGDNLAERLDKLATRNRAVAENIEKAALNTVVPGTRPPEPLSAKSGFMIRDPDYEDDDDDDGKPSRSMWSDDDDQDGLQSQAEKELAEALRRRKRLSGEV